jgi:hypothetical protein
MVAIKKQETRFGDAFLVDWYRRRRCGDLLVLRLFYASVDTG